MLQIASTALTAHVPANVCKNAVAFAWHGSLAEDDDLEVVLEPERAFVVATLGVADEEEGLATVLR